MSRLQKMFTRLLKRKADRNEPYAMKLLRSYAAPLRVLFVDDNHRLRELLVGMGERDFIMETTGAATLAEARALIREHEFDAVLLDQMLGDGEGIELYREIHDDRHHMRVVFFTGWASEEFRQRVESIGPAPVYSKNSMLKPGFLHQLLEELGAPVLEPELVH